MKKVARASPLRVDPQGVPGLLFDVWTLGLQLRGHGFRVRNVWELHPNLAGSPKLPDFFFFECEPNSASEGRVMTLRHWMLHICRVECRTVHSDGEQSESAPDGSIPCLVCKFKRQ